MTIKSSRTSRPERSICCGRDVLDDFIVTGSEAVGTVTLHKDEITRRYVPWARQGRGYGRALLDFAEKAIGEKFGIIRLEASLPAAALYWKRGYRVVDMLTEKQPSGDVLCWDVMEKTWNG